MHAHLIGLQATKRLITEDGARARAIAGISTGGLGSLITTMLARWLGLEAEKTTETAAGASARALIEESAEKATLITGAASRVFAVEGLAGVAGAAAFASTAAIPVVGPELAPGAAAAAVGAVQASVPMASLAVGAWDLPGDMVAQLHRGEMVVPQRFAEGVRNSGGGFGGVVVNYTMKTNDTAWFANAVKDHARIIAGAVTREMRTNPSLRPAY